MNYPDYLDYPNYKQIITFPESDPKYTQLVADLMEQLILSYSLYTIQDWKNSTYKINKKVLSFCSKEIIP